MQPGKVTMARSSPHTKPTVMRWDALEHVTAGDVDAPCPQFVEHEAAGGVVTDGRHQAYVQAQPCRAAGEDRCRAADRQRAGLDELLRLSVGERRWRPVQHDVRVGVADDQQVDVDTS